MNPGAEHVDEPAARPLRSEAERNRAQIIAAARRLLGRGGVSVSMASVARDAGVGIATLFRRFPTKEDLVAAVFADRMDAHVAAAAAALDDPDPWHGLVGFLESVCAMQAADYGFADVLTMTFPTAKALVLVYMANAGVVNAAGQYAPVVWRRVVALMIQSFEAPARGPLPGSRSGPRSSRRGTSTSSEHEPALRMGVISRRLRAECGEGLAPPSGRR
jgi:AcrR family transcriptional regulator